MAKNKKFTMTLSKEVSDIEKKIFEITLHSGLKGPEEYSEYKKVAQQFLDANKELVHVDQLKDVNFFDISIYPKIKREWCNEFSIKMFVLGAVVVAMRHTLRGTEPIKLGSAGPRRQVSPPFEAYTYVGFAELDINPEKTPYALLFEEK